MNRNSQWLKDRWRIQERDCRRTSVPVAVVRAENKNASEEENHV